MAGTENELGFFFCGKYWYSLPCQILQSCYRDYKPFKEEKKKKRTLLSSSGFCICLVLNFLGACSGGRVQCWNEKSAGDEEFQSWKVLAMLQVVTRLVASEGSSAWRRPVGRNTVRPPQKFNLGGKNALFWKV